MLSKNKIKYILSLHKKKYRQKYNKFIVEGRKICRDVLNEKVVQPELIIARDDWEDKVEFDLSSIDFVNVSEEEMRKVSALTNPSPILMICEMLEIKRTPNLKGHYIYLDQVRDPGNVGTIIRTADWFGMDGVFLSPGCAEVFNPKVIQASMGSVFRIPLNIMAYSDLKVWSEQIPLITSSMKGKDINDYNFGPSSIIVVGNEGIGISEEVFSYSSSSFSIPKKWSRGAESLNVAVAASIFMNAAARSRH